jgi:5-methyltetrahydrofolate--homocysteine methyltransferase
MHTVLRSRTREVIIGDDRPFCIIGERINPTGRKAFQMQLREGDLSQVLQDIDDQVAVGVHVLDVNCGVPLTDEADLLARTIRLVQDHSDLPICIDSSVIEALEAGLEAYEGRALVNSVTGEDERLAAILPLVKKHDAAVIALPNSAESIPMTVEERIEITGHIVEVATKEYGIAIEDIVIDPLAMPVGAEPLGILTTLETVRQIKATWGLNMTCGASNVSFGMPGRHTLNSAYLVMAAQAGMTSAIMDARSVECVNAVRASDVMLGKDQYGGNWIGHYRAAQAALASAAEAAAV